MAVKYIKGDFVVVPNLGALSNVSPKAVATFLWICTFADEYGQCYPSRSTLAFYLHFTRVQQIDKYIKELVDFGIIEKLKRKTDQKENMTNVYQILAIGIPPKSEKKYRGVVSKKALPSP